MSELHSMIGKRFLLDHRLQYQHGTGACSIAT